MIRQKTDAHHTTFIQTIKEKFSPYFKIFTHGEKGHVCTNITTKGAIALDKAIESGKIDVILTALKGIIPPHLIQQIKVFEHGIGEQLLHGAIKVSGTIAIAEAEASAVSPAAVSASPEVAVGHELVESALSLIGDAVTPTTDAAHT